MSINMNKKTSEQVAVIFGATGQVGSRVSEILALNHVKVVVHYFSNEGKANQIVRTIENNGGTAIALKADVRNSDEVKKLLQAVKTKFGHIDTCINLTHKNSAFKSIPIEELEWDDWTDHLDAVKSHFNICKAVVPFMKEQYFGRILYLSGGLAYRFYKGASVFSTVKAGLNAFCKTLALEVGEYNITVNIISPGRVVELNDAQIAGEFSDDNVSKCPMGRFASSDDIADAILYFMSPGASIVTGQTLYITGGEIMPMP